MADISQQLLVRFGLRTRPSQSLSEQWVQLTEALMRQGFAADDAGSRAAAAVFPDNGTCVYASEADTITSLLGRARDK